MEEYKMNSNGDVTTPMNEKDDSECDSREDTGDENKERGNWGHEAEFMLSCLGYAVGQANIWRFPYLCMRNGGGAFLIPYFACLFLCGMPLFFMELALGQFSNSGPISVWNICPLVKGCGWGMVIISGIACAYYNVIIAWVLYYLGQSMLSLGGSVLPWEDCGNEWNTDTCRKRVQLLANSSVAMAMNESSEFYVDQNVTVGNLTKVTLEMTPVEEYWQYNVLELSPGIGHLNGIKWELLLCLIAAIILVYLCICKGIKSSGKVVYVTATAPYVFLTILLIRGALLPGSAEGVKYYLTPDWSRLLQFQVWAEACLQIFYSLGPAWGGLITMSSYNKFNHDVIRDGLLIPLLGCLTSFYAGFVIFSVIGFMAHDAGLKVDAVVTQGPGLAFIAYPEALTKLPMSPIWALFFFIMLLTVGLDSLFTVFETVVSGVVDEFPKLLRKKKLIVTLLFCLVNLLLGLLFVTRGGVYWFQICDWYSASFSCMAIGFIECVAVGWVYGANRFYDDIELMTNRRPSKWWKVTWCFISPLFLLIMIGYNIFMMSPPMYGDYEYPAWALAFGWVLALCSIIPIPVVACVEIYKAKGSLWQRIKSASKPAASYGPALEKFRCKYNLGCDTITLNSPSPSGEKV